MSNNEQQADMYSVGYDNGYKNAKSDSDFELRELKIKLADALQAQAFWRECYHNAAGFWHADLRGANLYGADLRGANLYGADLRGAIIPSGVKIP